MAEVSSLLARSRGVLRSRQSRVDAVLRLLLVLGSFAQQPGRTTFDTKFDLTADPARFLGRALHLWNPQASLGELQNQAYGYLFPQGPFFLLGHVLGLPDWVTQRLWCAVLLLAAYEGARRLGRALAIGPWWAWSLAGLAYAATPRLLAEVGTLTGEIVPTVVLPWVVLPLVHVLTGRRSPRSGALLSGVAICFMGGLNAVENLAALPLAFLVVLAASPGVRARLIGWWVLAAGLASLWWLVPLVVLGRYSPPFLDYVETASVTTRPLAFADAVRGADHWLMFFTTAGRPWWPAGYALATEPLLVLVTGLVAALGFAGLLLRSMPLRGPLAASVLIGLACLYAGHDGSFGSPVAVPVQHLLDGPFAALRNVHKVDPLVRLPLALGVGHLTARVAEALSRGTDRRPHLVAGRARALSAVGVGVLVLLSALPLVTGQLRTPGWTTVPDAWQRTADYLAAHDDGSRALVVPGAGFARQTWGSTYDEPLQGLARSPWVTRNQVPLAPGQTIRALDAIETRVDSGTGSASLAADLARSGIGWVVDRHDLDPVLADAPSTARVGRSLQRSPGLSLVASFGRSGAGDQSLVDVWRVDAGAPRAQAVVDTSVRTVAGAADDVPTLLESGLLGDDQPTLTSGAAGRDAAAGTVADGYRRRERQFGRVRDALSGDMTTADPFQQDRPVHDYPGGAGEQRVHLDAGEIRSVDASSSAGFASTLGPVRPASGPYAALDASLATSWLSAPFTSPTRQWLELRFTHPVPVGAVRIQTDTDPSEAQGVLALRVRAGDRTLGVQVDPTTGRGDATFDGTPVSTLRVSISRVTGGTGATGRDAVVGLRDVSVARLPRHQQLVVPAVRTAAGTAWVLRAAPGVRPCVATLGGPACDLSAARPPEGDVELARAITLSTPQRLYVSGQVVARTTPSTATLTEPVRPRDVRVRATSVLGDDPSVSGQYAFDDDLTTSWLAAPSDHRPTLHLHWATPRTISRLQVVDSLSAAAAPTVAIVRAGDLVSRVPLSGAGLGYFPAVRTDRLSITFPRPAGVARNASVGIAELKIPALARLRYRPAATTATGAACGFGPALYVDGRTRRTYVAGSLDAVDAGAPLRLGLCGRPLALDAGTHELSLRASDRWAGSLLVLSPRRPAGTTVMTRTVRTGRWDPTDRTLRVGPGAAAVLRVPENSNPGWVATLGGTRLRPTVVDGWQQAWQVPAGAGGEVRLSFTPDTTYRAGLLAGGVAVLLLVIATGLSLVGERRSGRPAAVVPTSEASGRTSRTWPRLVGLGAAALVAVAVGGVLVAVGLVAGALLVRLRSRVPVAVAGPVLVALSAVVAAWSAASAGSGSVDVAPTAANMAAGLAVGLITAGWLLSPPPAASGTVIEEAA